MKNIMPLWVSNPQSLPHEFSALPSRLHWIVEVGGKNIKIKICALIQYIDKLNLRRKISLVSPLDKSWKICG